MTIPRDETTRPRSATGRHTRRSLLAGSAAALAAASVWQFEAAALGRGGRAHAGVARVPARAAQSGGTLTYGLGFDVDGTLDPQATHFDSTIRVTLNICEPLVWMPSATEIVPALAESWQISEDGLEYVFTLKQGVTFHDGTPFDAEAVKFTFDRVVEADKLAASGATGTPDPASMIVAGQSHDQIGPYDRAEVVDEHTVKLILSRPFTPFLSGLNGYLGIVSPTAVREMGLAEFARAPIGTGPFVFAEWVEADHITVRRNPDYEWGSSYFTNQGPPPLEEIVYQVIPDPAVRTGTLLSDETQYIDEIDQLQRADLEADESIVIIDQPQPGSGFVLLPNTSRPERAVTDQQVRQALQYAIDKEAFNQAVFGGGALPAASPLMRPTFAYDPATEEMYSYDPERAGTLLEEAGWVLNGETREKDGQPLELYMPIIDRPRDNAMATFLQGAFREIGIDMTVEPMERGAYSQTWREENNYDFSFMWFSYADPDVLRTIFHSENIGAFNRAQYANPEVDQMLEDAAASADPEERARLYAEIQRKVLDDSVVIPLVDTVVTNAKRARLEGDVLDYLASYVLMNDATLTE